ncbi:MAG TPA: aminodeoxychorismate/anthranilate synthase component II [Candidatus Nanopelagicaceae bacterium]|nr:aminodeoxychorismate/anthranilate synthase component II [Candidatus Nanopelagicaceae bacterium]
MSAQITKILVVDNYDSFVFNLVQYLAQLGAECTVFRNDALEPKDSDAFDGVLISPGPGVPEEAGISVELVRHCEKTGKPLLGVCLGHQAIAVAFGAKVSRAPELLHGKTSLIHHQGQGIFNGLPNPFTATRYHSLAVERDSLPAELEVTATTEDGLVMAIKHRDLRIEGVQFHPESVLTEGGHRLLANWLTECGDKSAIANSQGLAPVVAR